VRDFEDAVGRVHQAGLLAVGHAILGLPGDQGAQGARRTAEALARAGTSGVKVHNLMVLRRTQLEKSALAGEVEVPDLESYVAWLADFVERLSPEQVLHRTSADALPGELVAPERNFDKNELRTRLVRTLQSRGTRQGSHARAARGVTAPRS
jgi:uncharacterized protein